ncbi:hypothetical protein R3P38DRAFT_3352091 [Favolaschia claudopus]|uniref:Uncharacterized protein n=1 Tax=Favolaschia claudopus TaxID=2862362 RepID=A0AAW0BZ64_9AGAR
MLETLLVGLFCLRLRVFAKTVTTILDDASSNIAYTPAEHWQQCSNGVHGRIIPDATRAQGGTYHDATDDTTPNHDGDTAMFLEISFTGTGIDLRAIIANNKADNTSIPPFTGTKSNYSFFIDAVAQNQDYVHEAGTTGDAFLYNTSIFSTNSLSNGPHTAKVLLNGGFDVDGSVVMLFDYAIVTSDDGTSAGGGTQAPATIAPPTTPAGPPSTSGGSPPNNPSSSAPTQSGSSQQAPGSSGIIIGSGGATITGNSSPALTQSSSASGSPSSPAALPLPHSKSHTGALIGGVVGALLVILLLLFLLWRYRRRRSSRRLPRLPLPYNLTGIITPITRFRRPRSVRKRTGDGEREELDPASASSSAPLGGADGKRALAFNVPSSSSNSGPSSSAPLSSVVPPSSSGPSSNSGSGSGSSIDPALRDYVLRLRAEVEILRQREREGAGAAPGPVEVIPMRDSRGTGASVLSDTNDPPPRYEER